MKPQVMSVWNSSGILAIAAIVCGTSMLKAQPLFLPIDHKQQAPDPRVAFVENLGQVANTDGDPAEDILYSSYGNRLHLFLRRQNILSFVAHAPLPLESYHRWDLQLTGEMVNPLATATAVEPEDWHHNYYLPHCQQGITNVPGYKRVVYRDVYPNTDLHVYSNLWGYKFYFVIKPGGTPSDILLQFQGQDSLTVDQWNELKGWVGSMQFRFPHAIAYQQINGSTQLVPWQINYDQLGDQDLVSFTFGSYDSANPLIIDISESAGPLGEPRDAPTPEWSTYYGGEDVEELGKITDLVDDGMVACGRTWSPHFPVNTGPLFNQNTGYSDAFITYFDENYSRMWTTFWGGDSNDSFTCITQPYGNGLIVSGYTESNPSSITWFGPEGSFVDNTRNDVDPFSCVVIAEFTDAGIPYWTTLFGPDVFMSILPSESKYKIVANIDVDLSGNLFVAGNYCTNMASLDVAYTNQPTESSMPIYGPQGAYLQDHLTWTSWESEQPPLPMHEPWIAKFDPGRQLVWSTMFGGNSWSEAIEDMAVDKATGHVLIVGTTTSPGTGTWPCAPPAVGQSGFPWCSLSGAYDQQGHPVEPGSQWGKPSAFIAGFSNQSALYWCTAFRGPGELSNGLAIGIDKDGERIHIAGYTESPTYSTTICSPFVSGFPVCNTDMTWSYPFQSNASEGNGFAASFDRASKSLLWSSYLGACEPTDLVAADGKFFISAARISSTNTVPLMDAAGYYADVDAASEGDGVIFGFDRATPTGLFYGTLWGGDDVDQLTSISYVPTYQHERLYVGGMTTSANQFPLHCPPIVDPLNPPWCVDQLQPDGYDLFYGQVKLDLESATVGIATSTEDAKVPLFFPNPTNGRINAILDDYLRERIRIVEVYASIGNLVWSFSAIDLLNNGIDLKLLENGIYVLICKDSYGMIICSELIEISR